MKSKNIKRNKAFLGAVIGAVGSIASSVLSAKMQAKAQKEALKAQKEAQEAAILEQNKANTLQSAQNLSAAYADQSYVDDFNKRVTFRAGGKLNLRGYDRIEVMKMGGHKRRKC